jgi:5-methylcytosine-specific restriction protein A
MPNAALRPCSYPGGCTTLVHSGRCERHRQADAEAHYRDPQVTRWYHSRQWREMSARQLEDYPWCEECLSNGVHRKATDVDHVDPHHGDRKAFFTGRLQSLCHSHHTAKTNRERAQGTRGAEKSL